MPQCVVVAGGIGSRLSKMGILTPKLLLEINGKTLLSYILEEVVREGYTKILFCLGFQAEKIISAIKEIDAPIQIDISVEESQLGTLGALEHSRSKLDAFFTVLMGDTFLSGSNIGSIHLLCESLNLKALALCKFTDHASDSDLLEIDEFGRVLNIFRDSSHGGLPRVNISLAGVSFLAKELISSEISTQPRDITRHLLVEAKSKGVELQALFHQGTIRDLGTPERLSSFSKAQAASSLDPICTRDQTILLDRDGTLNEARGHISSINEIQILPIGFQIAEKVKRDRLNAFLITNQPVIARGEASDDDVLKICSALLQELEIWQGIDHIYVCPHYPEAGFQGEVVELKIQCECRKPMPGLLLKAANEHNFRLTESTMVGDSPADIYAGLLVGARVVHLHHNSGPLCRLDTPLEPLLSCFFVEEMSKILDAMGAPL